MKVKTLMTMALILFSILTYPQSKGDAFKVRWELQITDPEFELKYYKLDEATYKAFLPKTGWRCRTSETQRRGNIQLKKLYCDYSIEKTGTVTTTVSCSPERPYSEVILELFDERKDLNFQVMLNCRKND
jgi:hypothetical protein